MTHDGRGKAAIRTRMDGGLTDHGRTKDPAARTAQELPGPRQGQGAGVGVNIVLWGLV